MVQSVMERSNTGPESRALAELEVQLQRQLRGQVHDLRLSRRGIGLTLHGYAYTYYAKQLAQHAVMSATSVPVLSNEIAVI